MLTKNEYLAWTQSDTTEKILKIVQNYLDEQIAQIANGSVLCDSSDETALKVARIAGRIDGLSVIFNLEDEMENEE